MHARKKGLGGWVQFPAILSLITVLALAFGACASGGKGGGAGALGAPRSQLMNLDPQMSWPYDPTPLAGMEGKFYVNGEAEGYVTVFDATTQKKLKVLNFWEYEKGLLLAAGKPADEKAMDFIQKNMKPHHSWITPGGHYNYISNNSKGSDRIWVVDTRTDKIVSNMNTGGMGPLHMAFSPFRDLAVAGAVQDKEKGVATFIDTHNHKVLGTVLTQGTQTRDVVFTPDNRHVYISNSGWDPDKGNMGGVTMIDIDTMKVVKHFDIPGSRGMKMTYDGKLAGVASIKKGFVAFIDMEKHEIIAKVEVGKKPNNISFHPDGTRAYVGLAGEAKFAVIDLKTMTVKTKIPAGKDANAAYFPPGNSKIAIGTNEADDFVTVIDTVNDKKIKDIFTPLGAHNVAYTPDGKLAIVSCRKSREAVFINVDKLEDIKVVNDAGHANNGVRWAPYHDGMSSKQPYGS